MLLCDFLTDSADKLPKKTALIFQGKSYSYQIISEKANSLASYFIRQGISRGDRIGIYLDNSPEAVISVFGTLLAGGCFVIINPTIKEQKLRYILENSNAKFLIGSPAALATIDKALEKMTQKPELILTGASDHGNAAGFDQLIARKHAESWPRPIDIDLAAIIYTSGSTGEPKGVTLTHRNMVSAATSITTYLENVADDIILDVLPFSFDYGLYQLLMTFLIGGTLVLEKSFGYPRELVELIKKEKITGLPCVPTMMAILLQMDHLDREGLNTVRYISNTAAKLPPTFIPRLQRAFPNARIFSMYGLTECKRVAYLPPALIDKKPESVGIAMPNEEVWIVDENDKVLPFGQVGELVVRGANVMQGYWKDPVATAKVLKPGRYPWEKVLYTGDLFRMDEEGYLYFVGRKDDIIKSRGERVSPVEIETVLYSMEEVLNARVIGVPHDIYGQAIKAEIIVKEGHSLDEKKVKAYCRQHLEDLIVPQIVEFVKELPISASGKIKRRD